MTKDRYFHGLMFRCIAIVFSFISIVAFQTHNFIAHDHTGGLHKKPNPGHHHNKAHGHHHEHDQTPDSHDPEFGKYLVYKHDARGFTFDQEAVPLYGRHFELLTSENPHIPLYYISPHETIPRQLILAAVALRGPPSISML